MMRTFKNLFFIAALATGFLTSCNDDDNNEECFGKDPVTFTSNISSSAVSRASGTQWGVDAIGVYMKKAGDPLSETSIVDDAKNKKYTTPGDGNFIYATPEDMIYFPQDGSQVDFIAYYPYQEELTSLTYAVNVSDQSHPEDIDLLYSDNATNLNKASTAVGLQFDHMLTNLVLNVKDETNQGLAGMTVTITGMSTQADFSLADGTFTRDAGSTQNINALVAVNSNEATVSAILLPVITSGNTVIFQITGRTYIWEIEDGVELKGKNRYTFDINLKSNGTVDVLNPQGTINDWINNNGGTVDLGDGGGEDPGPGPGGDTLEFLETFGPTWRAGTTGTLTAKWDDFVAKDQFDMKAPIAYSTSSDAIDFRCTNSYDNPHIWFAANFDKLFRIEGIEAGYSNMTISFDLAANAASTSSAGMLLKCNGNDVTVPAETLGASNEFSTLTVNIPDGTTTVEFYTTPASNTVGYRLDNIKITGSK